MAKFKEHAGLKTGAKAPSSIANAEHHDKSGTKKTMQVVPGSLDAILANSNVETAVAPKSVVRFFNNSGAVAFIWTGIQGDSPVGVPDITNGYAIGIGQEMIIAFAEPEDQSKSAAFKTSVATVQAALIES